MTEEFAMTALSLAGHDKGQIYVIIEANAEYVYLADGKYKTIAVPKRKNRKHIQINHDADQILIEKKNAGTLADSDIRRVVKKWRLEHVKSRCCRN